MIQEEKARLRLLLKQARSRNLNITEARELDSLVEKLAKEKDYSQGVAILLLVASIIMGIALASEKR